MKLSYPVKILFGLATAIYALFPILLIPLWLLAVIFAGMGASSYQGEPPPQFFFLVFSMFPLIFLVNMLHFILIPFYIIHLVKNESGRELYRILLGIGLFFLSWLAMPFYFFLYVWPNRPPSWALKLPSSPMPAAIPIPSSEDEAAPQTALPSETSPESSAASVEAPPLQPPVEAKDLPAAATIVQPTPLEAQPAKETKKPRPRRSAKTQAASVTLKTPKKDSAPDQSLSDQDHTIISPKPPSGDTGDLS